MKTVSDDFLAAQANPSSIGLRKVSYKRRRWDASTRAYVWEDDWTDMEAQEVISISSISWQLDTEQQNEFKVSNVTLLMQNEENQWRYDNPDGIFAPDDDSPLYRYEPYWMKFRVQAGYELADGTEEYLTIFTGLAVDYNIESDKRSCQVSIQGLEIILMNAKAEDIATDVTEENAGSGNGVTTAFTTANPGVGGIREVSVAGIKKVEGSDYDVSNLNSASVGATATFAVAPASGTVRITYFYWPQSVTFKSVVESLLTAAGIDSARIDVEDVFFQNNVFNAKVYTNQQDFDAGTKSHLDTAIEPGVLRVDWAHADFVEATTWGEALTGWTQQGLGTHADEGAEITHTAPNSGGFGIPSFNSSFTRPHARKLGILQVDFKFHNLDVLSIHHSLTINHGFSIGFSSDGTWGISGVSPFSTWTPDTNWHTVKVIRYGNGRILVYLDSVLKFDVTNANYINNATSLSLGHNSSTKNGVFKVGFRNVSIPVATGTASWLSAAFDIGSTPTAFDQMLFTFLAPTGMTLQTQTSADNVSYDALVTIDPATNIPQSTLRRYVKVKISWSVSTELTQEPSADDIVLRYATTSTNITLPGFSGDSVYDAVQKLGQFANYEFGFNPDETFFFRPKLTGQSLMSLDQSNFISKVLSMDKGDSRIYGTVRATYGSFSKEITEDGNAPESVKARALDNRLEITPDSNIQIPGTADIATGVAQGFFRYFSVSRQRIRIETKFLPQLDLSDPVELTVLNRTPVTLWYLGDDAVYLGQEGTHLWGEREQIAYKMPCRVVSMRIDPQNFKQELELEEVV